MPSAAAASRDFARSREAMASIDINFPCCMPGITFLTPIAAVLRTPQRIFFGIVANHKARPRENAKASLSAKWPGPAEDWCKVHRIVYYFCAVQSLREDQSNEEAALTLRRHGHGVHYRVCIRSHRYLRNLDRRHEG